MLEEINNLNIEGKKTVNKYLEERICSVSKNAFVWIGRGDFGFGMGRNTLSIITQFSYQLAVGPEVERRRKWARHSTEGLTEGSKLVWRLSPRRKRTVEEVADWLERPGSGRTAAAEGRIGRIGNPLGSVGAVKGAGWSEVNSTDSAEVEPLSLEAEDLGSIPTDPETHTMYFSEGLRHCYLDSQKLRVQ